MRIQIVMGVEPTGSDAVLVEAGGEMPVAGYAVEFAVDSPKPGHFAGCGCCTLRGAAADALTAMFRARATNRAPFFNRIVVLASPQGEAMVRDAVQNDVVCGARYRLA